MGGVLKMFPNHLSWVEIAGAGQLTSLPPCCICVFCIFFPRTPFHFPLGSCCYVTLHWVNSIWPGNAEGKWDADAVTALIFPFNAVAVGELRLWLCFSMEHTYINVSVLSAFGPYRKACSIHFILLGQPPWVQYIWWGPQGTVEPKRGLDVPLSYVMSEWCLFVYF